MKSVGVKVLKDNLSAYLKYVKNGETVLVTDRDEVIAEIRRPRAVSNSMLSRFEQFLIEASERGEVRLASDAEDPIAIARLRVASPIKVDVAEILNETRSDRF